MTDTTPEPTTPQEWNQAALEELGWTHKIAAQVGSWRSPPSTNYPKGRYTDFPPDLTSVDACLKHIVPVMVSKHYWLDIDNCADPKIWVATFVHCGTKIGQDENPRGEESDLALALVKAFVRAMKGSQ